VRRVSGQDSETLRIVFANLEFMGVWASRFLKSCFGLVLLGYLLPALSGIPSEYRFQRQGPELQQPYYFGSPWAL
jgi:hypothetical protein